MTVTTDPMDDLHHKKAQKQCEHREMIQMSWAVDRQRSATASQGGQFEFQATIKSKQT